MDAETIVKEHNATQAPERADIQNDLRKVETTEGSTNVGVQAVTSAGWVWIYQTQTHEPSRCNLNMLRKKLEEKFPDGTPCWDTRPHGTPSRGTLKCLLHPDNPNRDHFDELGFAVCKKSNMKSPFQVNRHMASRHPMELATIEKEKQDKKEAATLEYQKSIIELAQRRNDGTGTDRQTDERVGSPSGETKRHYKRRRRTPKQG